MISLLVILVSKRECNSEDTDRQAMETERNCGLIEKEYALKTRTN